MGRRSRSVWVPPGVLSLRKPIGATSHDVVDFVRRLLPRGARVGHTGTLDPFAEGVLPVCLGGMTRLADRLGDQPKVYRALLDLTLVTDTGDHTGEVVEEFDPGPMSPGRSVIEAAMGRFLGEIEQIPPAYSAIHIDGERAYVRARRGEVVEMPSRKVTIYSLELLEDHWPQLDFRVRCSRGTYVRTLGEDLGRALGFGGTLRELVRESVGALDLASSRTHFQCLEGDLLAQLAPLSQCFPEIRPASLGPQGVERILQGGWISPEDLEVAAEGEAAQAPPQEGEEFFLFPRGEEFPLALAVCQAGSRIQPVRVMGRKE